MDGARPSSWRRREFLAAGVAGLAVPLSLSLTAQGASGRSIGTGLMRALVEREAASIGYWSASEFMGNLSEISLVHSEPTSKEVSTAAHGGIVLAKRITSAGIDQAARIRVAGCALPMPRGQYKRSISLDILFDTASGRLPVHALHADGSCNGEGGCGGEMVLPVEDGRVAIAARTSETDQSILEIPARRGVYVVGWRDPRTGAMPRWGSVRIETRSDTLRLVTTLGQRPEFPFALLTLDRSLA